jgi:hypothetical protein
MRSHAHLLMAGALLLACLSQVSASAKKSTAQQQFEDNPGGLAIDSGRLPYIIERSEAGLDLAEPKAKVSRSLEAESLLSADRALKETAMRLLLLRNRLLEMGLVKEQEVRPTVWPRWIFEPPSASESPDTLDARLVWISTEAAKLTEIGCDIGRKKTKDPLFCSVE